MTARHPPTRHGLSFLEFILALAVTAMITAAISVMVSAVSVGELSRRDNRGYIVRTYAAKSRLSAYVARSLAVLDVNGSDAVIWLNDWRGGGRVHATEIRWFIYDSPTNSMKVYYVDFPDSWNAHDSLGEAYLAHGNVEAARAEYERSLELNPENENAREVLRGLSE